MPNGNPRKTQGRGFGRDSLKLFQICKKTPPLAIKEPAGKKDSTKRLESKEGRTNDSSEQKALCKLDDAVCRLGVEGFHWDLSN